MAMTDKTCVVSPNATEITVPTQTAIPVENPAGVLREDSYLRVSRPIQLHLARSVTFGVLGDDNNLYPSSKWVTEKQDNFANRQTVNFRTRPDFVITSLDTRKHNPQPKQIFHIKRINKKPVCNVQSWVSTGGPQEPQAPDDSIYTESFKERPKTEPIRIVHREEKEKPIEGIVPVNISGSKVDVRSEMMLPMCDSTNMPSARNPHHYLLRKRKVPPPYNITTGIVYPNLEHPRMVSFSPGTAQNGTLPFPNESREPSRSLPRTNPERISVSSLSGMNFSRRKFIQPPSGNIFSEPRPGCISSLAGKQFSRRRRIDHPQCELRLDFDGGVAETTSSKFDDRHLPFIRAKTII